MNAIDRPVRFGSVEIESPLILAPTVSDDCSKTRCGSGLCGNGQC